VVKKPLREQVLVVTGASSGLGRAIARLAGERGARVVVTARNEDALENCMGEIERAGSEALAVPGDVSDQSQVQRVVEAAVERFGRIDTYVANAIVTVYAEVERLEPEELRRVWEVNFFGVVYGYWAALPHLRSSRGTFLHVSSALAYRGIPLQAAYCSTKAGLRAFLESARVEEQKAGTGVAVSLVLPGAINTPQFDRDRQKLGYQPEPVPPIYQPEAFAEATLHCAEHPVRELPISWGAQKLLWGQKLTPRAGRLDPQAVGLEEPAHRRAQAARRARQPLRYAARRPRSARQVRRSIPWLHGLDAAPFARTEGLMRLASMTSTWLCSN
jgi:NAD(P)-dependent dehydrogenase (short-subunit alcohol dehydrogenase family)